MNDNVLVVGAGPVGLAGAVGLALAGVKVRIIDRLPAPINQSRAAIVHARTMEHFERLGFADAFLAAGVRVFGVAVYGERNELLTRATLEHLPTRFPFMLGLEQFETERLLTEQLKKAGVEIERGVELVSLSDDGEKVTARIRGVDGTESLQDFAYVLGADGARSAVRSSLGLSLDGETLETTWITVDVKMDWDKDPGEAVAYLSSHGIAFIAAMNDGRWRVIVSHHKLTVEEASKLTLEDVQVILRERCGTPVSLSDCVWISPFGINTRMASTMNKGRVFLAGDAAHVHSPVGGQGMNTGIQDALNLAWKLAMVLKGEAKPALLESFNAERHANAKKLLKAVGPATKLANMRNPLATELRTHVVHLVGMLGLNKNVPSAVSMLTVGYPDSPAVEESHVSWLSRGPRAGERAPDAEGLITSNETEHQRLFSLWAGDRRHQLLVFSEKEDHGYPESPLYATIRLIRQGIPKEGVVVDAHEEAYEAYAAREGSCYLVRPDGIVAFRSGTADAAALREYLAKWF